MFPRPLQTPCFGSKPPLASLQAWSHNTCTLGDCVARIKFIIPPDETCTCSFWNACPIQADHTDVCSVYGSGVEFSTLHAKNSKVHCMVENPHRILQVLYRNSRHGTVNTLSFERNFFGPHTLFRWEQPRGYAVQNSSEHLSKRLARKQVWKRDTVEASKLTNTLMYSIVLCFPARLA